MKKEIDHISKKSNTIKNVARQYFLSYWFLNAQKIYPVSHQPLCVFSSQKTFGFGIDSWLCGILAVKALNMEWN